MTIQQANASKVMVPQPNGALSLYREVGLCTKAELCKALAHELKVAARMGRPLDMVTIAACALRGVS